ncbi:uncharacterized protein LOC109807308 [Cajanus cajan]|uniref:uncharacterized protein LOC109807308 n=1 Tax=Cajanus cajan TaxID=3821 RepID=UPI00098D861C|nr:uncharacterized protein LOC109807308 [Cajanus cajan]
MKAERVAAGAARPTGSQESRDLAEFRKCNPPQFAGDADPEVADCWIHELEKIFSVLGCSLEKRLAYDVYMLVGEAEHWWRGTYQMLVARGVIVDWECFRMVFMEKYFPESTISEAWNCRKFAKGLKYELKKVVVPMAITEFPALVEKAKIVERLEGGDRVIRATEGPAGSKRGGGSQRKPYDRPQSQQGGPVSRQFSSTASGGRQSGGATLRCYSVQRAETQRGDRPTIAGRVFSLTGAEASTSSDIVKGKGKAAGKNVIFLFDSGASHSFISYACVAVLGMSVCDLGLRLLVSTPASSSVVASELCANCPVVVNGKKYKVNLIYCANRRLIFPKEEDELLISAGQAESLLRDGAECCLLLAAMSVETERVIS